VNNVSHTVPPESVTKRACFFSTCSVTSNSVTISLPLDDRVSRNRVPATDRGSERNSIRTTSGLLFGRHSMSVTTLNTVAVGAAAVRDTVTRVMATALHGRPRLVDYSLQRPKLRNWRPRILIL